jgi:hypothetical protein
VAVLSMSKQEFSRLKVLLQVQTGRLCVADVCELIGLHRRRVFRLLRDLKQDGATSLLSKRRGKIHTVQPGAIVDNKRLLAVLELVKAQPAAYPARKQRGHATRQRPPNNLEAPGLPSKGRAPRHAATATPARGTRMEG